MDEYPRRSTVSSGHVPCFEKSGGVEQAPYLVGFCHVRANRQRVATRRTDLARQRLPARVRAFIETAASLIEEEMNRKSVRY